MKISDNDSPICYRCGAPEAYSTLQILQNETYNLCETCFTEALIILYGNDLPMPKQKHAEQ